MKKRKFLLVLISGICLVLIGVSLMVVTQMRIHAGKQHSKHILEKLDGILPERKSGLLEMYLDSGMPVLEIDGEDYVCVIEIPSFDVTLPVADRWDSNKVFGSPARFFGSAYDGSLIIGGADISQQFGFCKEIELGTLVTVTDMTGTQFTYVVSDVDRAKHAETKWLMDAECDLTLFCRDLYSMEYIAVRFVYN